MRVAVFSDTQISQVNGVAITLLRMKAYMDHKDIEYCILVPEEQESQETMDKVIGFRCFSFPLYPECKIAFPAYARAKRILDEFRPDLVHLETPFSMGLFGLKYALDNGLPVAASYHTNFPQYLKYYRLSFLEGWLWKYFRWFHSRCLINYCPSHDTLIELEKRGFENLEVLGHSVDTSTYTPELRCQETRRRYGVEEEALLLYVGRISPEKELNVLLQAVSILQDKGYYFKLLIVGDGPSRRRLEGRNLPDVVFTGYRFGEELQKIYASSDIFVFPSRTETFGKVILEAMASGLPVVGADGGGVKDNLVDGQNSVLFPPGDSEAMAAGIGRLLLDKDLRERLGRNARRHSLNSGWDEVFASRFRQYQEVIGRYMVSTRA